LSPARGFIPSIRFSNKSEKITFSFADWHHFTELIPKLDNFFKNGVEPNVNLEGYTFKVIMIGGTKYIQIGYHNQIYTINKGFSKSITPLLQLIYKRLLVLERKGFRNFYDSLLMAAVNGPRDTDIYTNVSFYLNDIKTDNALWMEEALRFARDKVLSDYVKVHATTCQRTQLKPLADSSSNGSCEVSTLYREKNFNSFH